MSEIVSLKRRNVSMEIVKTQNFTALIWNSCKLCDPRKCPIAGRCASITSDGEICGPQSKYLESIYSAALDMLGVSLNTREAVRLGLHIIPMYSILFDLKIALAEVQSCWTYYGKHGDIKINPIYREIRDHIKAIDDLWSKLGYKQLVGHGSSMEGDGAYCDNMFVED